MKKILLDTNVVLDLLAKREPFYMDAALLFSHADQKKIVLTINALTFAKLNYILGKLKSVAEAREILSRFRVLVNILPLNEKIIDLALADRKFKDFEDALQYYSALDQRLDIIITRDMKGFKPSRIAVMTPETFLKSN